MPKFRRPRDRDGFRIAIICAVTRERDAVMQMLDEHWDAAEYRKAPGDPNTYRMGRIGPHNVVVVQLPGTGTQEAASTSASFRFSFRNITLGLVVGVCGGVPTMTDSGDIVLGDVILSTEIIDFTFGRQYDNQFCVKDTLSDLYGRPNREIRGFLKTMEGKQDRAKLKAQSSAYLKELCKKVGFESFHFPGSDRDVVYLRRYRHKHQQPGSCADCAACHAAEDALEEAEAAGLSANEIRKMEEKVRGAAVCAESVKTSCEELQCDTKKAVLRTSSKKACLKDTAIREPGIHFGVIGSGNSVLKSGYLRDELAEKRRIIAFEMEAAGIWDNFPTVVIKAVCDYADSHKSKVWQDYAAASAAACMKAFLVEWPVTDDPSPDVAIATRIIQRFPFPRNDDFVIRKAIFSKLENLLPPTSLSQSAVLWGLGGSGKTQIALDFAYRRYLEHHWTVFWVHASSYDQFLQGYRHIAADAGLAVTLQDPELLITVRSWLESQADWLLILDNADDLTLFGAHPLALTTDSQANLMSFVPRGSHGSILWTTRDERAIGHLVGMSRGINVDAMTDDEAKELLTGLSAVVETTDNAGDVSGILNRLERLPLAISQAAAFIRAQHVSYNEYLQRLTKERKRWRVLAQDGPNRYRPDGVPVPNNVMETWQITVDHLERAHPLAHWILMVIVYFHTQDIPWLLVRAVGVQWLLDKRHMESSTSQEEAAERANEASEEDSDAEDDDVRAALSRLTQFCMVRARIDVGRGADGYDIHPLVQDATRYTIWQKSKSSQQPARQTAGETALSVISHVFPSGAYGTWYDCARLLTHVLTLRQWPDLAHQRFKMCDTLERTWLYLHGQGRLAEAEEICREVLGLRREELGEKHPNTIRSMADLSATYHQQGRWSEAEKNKIEVLELRREVLGEKHTDTFHSMASLATTYHQQGRWSEAEKIKTEVLELRREVLGEKHSDTIDSIASLATTYLQQGRTDESEEMNKRVLKLRREVLGERHPDTITAMANLVASYHQQGRWSEAEEIRAQVLELRREVLGEKHPDTIRSMVHLAATYHQQGRLSEADRIRVDVLKPRREVLGEKHPDTIRSMIHIAAIYYQQGRLSEVEEIDKQVLKLQREVLGEKHLDTIKSMVHLAATYHQQGQWSKAEETDIQVLQLQREVLGEKHPDTINSMASLAATYYQQGRFSKLEHISTRVFELRREVLGEKHPDTIKSMASLAVIHHQQGRLSEAERIRVDVLTLRQEVLGEKHLNTIKSMAHLAATYYQQGQLSKAREMNVKVLELRREVLGDNHPDTVKILEILRTCF